MILTLFLLSIKNNEVQYILITPSTKRYDNHEQGKTDKSTTIVRDFNSLWDYYNIECNHLEKKKEISEPNNSMEEETEKDIKIVFLFWF